MYEFYICSSIINVLNDTRTPKYCTIFTANIPLRPCSSLSPSFRGHSKKSSCNFGGNIFKTFPTLRHSNIFWRKFDEFYAVFVAYHLFAKAIKLAIVIFYGYVYNNLKKFLIKYRLSIGWFIFLRQVTYFLVFYIENVLQSIGCVNLQLIR